MFHDFVVVKRSEGFHSVMTASCPEEVPGIVSQLLELGYNPPGFKAPRPDPNKQISQGGMPGTSYGDQGRFPNREQTTATSLHIPGTSGFTSGFPAHVMHRNNIDGVPSMALHVQRPPQEHYLDGHSGQAVYPLPEIYPYHPDEKGVMYTGGEFIFGPNPKYEGNLEVSRRERHPGWGLRRDRGSAGRSGELPVTEALKLFADPACPIPYDDLPAGSTSGQWQASEDGGAVLTPSGPDPRIILLFDLNGTLTSHTSQRYSSGINRVRPKVEMLLQLKPQFRRAEGLSGLWLGKLNAG